MSAIAGIIHFDDRPVDRDALDRMARALRPWGPHRRQQQVVGGAGLIFAGHHFTPEDRFDQQPVKLPDGRWLLFCGRLDNRPELIRELALNDADADRLADSMLAAKVWLRWGRDGLLKLVGPHASACWDPKQRRLSLARGAGLGRSLLVHRSGASLYFSTVVQGLFALPWIPREMDEEVLGDILLSSFKISKFLYKDIESVALSHCVDYTLDGAHAHRYWAPDPAKRLRFKSEPECWEAFAELFEQVVRQHLRTTGKIGIRLSGGFDSAAIAAQAALIMADQNATLHGYTRVPMADGVIKPDTKRHYNDERPRVELLQSGHPNLQTHFIEPGDTSVLEGMRDWFAANYTPANASPTFMTGYRPLLERAKADGIKLLLNGGMGNLSFSYHGYGRLRELFYSGRWWRLRHELRGLARQGVAVRQLVRDEIVESLIPRPLLSRYRRWQHDGPTPWSHFSGIHPEFAVDSGAAQRMLEQQNLRIYWQHLNGWQRRAYHFTHPGQAAQGGGGDVLYGLDQRDPAADRRLVEFCLALPERYYLHDGIDRRLVRCGMTHLLPETIRQDYRHGLQDVDWAHRLKRDHQQIRDTLHGFRHDPDVSRYIDVARLEKMWEEFEQTDWTRAPHRKVVAYKLALLGPLHAGSFIRWFHGRNQ